MHGANNGEQLVRNYSRVLNGFSISLTGERRVISKRKNNVLMDKYVCMLLYEYWWCARVCRGRLCGTEEIRYSGDRPPIEFIVVNHKAIFSRFKMTSK